MEIPLPTLVSLLAVLLGLLTWQQSRMWKMGDDQRKAIEKWMEDHRLNTKDRFDRFERQVDDKFSALTQQVNNVSLQIVTRRRNEP